MSLVRIVLLWCLVMAGAAHGQAPPVALQSLVQGASLSQAGQLSWLADPDGQLTPQAVRQPQHAARFTAAPHPPTPASRAHPYWFKVELRLDRGAGDWVLATQTTALQDVRFYGPYDASGRALAGAVHTGLSRPFASRPLGSERYVGRLQLDQPGLYTVYVRMVGGTETNLDLSLWETTGFLQWRQHKRLFDGICYGILLALLVYNLVLAAVFRDRTYGLYTGQCALALLTLASYNGHAASYLWSGWPWWQERANVVLPALWTGLGILFARSFLHTRRQAPRLDRLLLVLTALAAGAALLGLAGPPRLAQLLNEALAATATLTGIAAALAFMRAGSLPARWYLAGQGALFLSVLAVVLINWNWFSSPFLQANGLQLGVAAEMVVFAIALSSRIQGMRASETQSRLHAAQMAQVASTDPLTGLYNRAGLAQGASVLLAAGAEQALLLLDLDRFKPINDTHGHEAGDAVLCAVARRLQAHLRAHDLAARLGGDEFVLLLAGDWPDGQLRELAQRIVQAVARPVRFQGVALTVEVSIGIARRPRDADTLAALMRCADRAMYRAKLARSGHAFAEPG